MKDLIAWFGLKELPFDKNIKTQEAFKTESLSECAARLDYIKRRGGILLLTGDPGLGKTLALRRFVDNLNENLFKPFYTPLSTLSRADLLCHLNRLLGLPHRVSKSAIYAQIQRALLALDPMPTCAISSINCRWQKPKTTTATCYHPTWTRLA